jgi:hypothetical protein
MKDQTRWSLLWRLFVSEAAGTALLLVGGLSAVILMFGEVAQSPLLFRAMAHAGQSQDSCSAQRAR